MVDDSTNVLVKFKRFLKTKNSFEIISLINSTLAITISFFTLYHSVWSWESKLDVVVNSPISIPKEKKLGLDVTLVNTGTENIFVNKLYGACALSPIGLSSDGERVQIYNPSTFELVNEYGASDWNPNIDSVLNIFPGDSYKDILLKPGEIRNFKLLVEIENKCLAQTRFESNFYIYYEMLPAKGKGLQGKILVARFEKNEGVNSNYFLQLNRALRYEWDVNTSVASSAFSPLAPLDKYELQLIHYTLDFHCNTWDFQYCNN